MRRVAQAADTDDGSLSACIASILELELAGAPAHAAAWKDWLAARNLRLTPAADPPGSGFWIGVRADGHHVVMFGSPPDVVWDPRGAAAPPSRPVAALVLSALDPLLPAGPAARPERAPGTGTVEAIYIAAERSGPCRAVERAEAVAGRGLRGDRYYHRDGTFSEGTLTGGELTLIEAEALEELAAVHGVDLDPAEARRNLLTRGIALNDLVGRRFGVGDVECVGRRWCEPCAHLQRLTREGTLRGLVHRGGLRADILDGGEIAVGAPVRAHPDA